MEHSRLLKYILPEGYVYKSKMAEPVKIKFEYRNPNNVEAEVPGTQNIREAQNDAENGEPDSRPAGTKRDTDTEVETEVMEDGGVIRRHVISVTNGGDKNDDKRSKTKIPVSRFRQTVEKVKAERRGSRDKKKNESHLPIRRPSLPKLRDRRAVRKEVTVAKIEATEQITAPEDEFDKLYNEVVCSTPTEVNINVSMLNPKLDDAEKLESKFEEIIHDYDENKVQPIDVDKVRRSKIPFLRRRSQQDMDVNVQADRSSRIIAAREKLRMRHSSKSEDYDSKEPESTSKSKENKLYEAKQAKIQENNKGDSPQSDVIQYTKTIITTSSKDNEDDEFTKIGGTTTITEVKTSENSEKKQKLQGQLIEENIYKESIKVGIPVFDSSIHEYTEKSNTEETIETKRVISYSSNNGDFEIEEAKVDTIVISKPNIVEIIDVSDNFTNKKPETVAIQNENPVIKIKEKEGSREDSNDEKLRGIVGRIISRIDSNKLQDEKALKNDFAAGIPKKKSVLSKIAMFERQEVHPAVTNSKLPKTQSKLPKLLTNDLIRTDNVHVHTPLIVDEVFKPFEAKTELNGEVNTVAIATNDHTIKEQKATNDKYVTEIVKAEMVVIESPEYVRYDVENKTQVESNTLSIQESKVDEEVLTPVLRKFETKDVKIDIAKVIIPNVKSKTETDAPIIIPKFIPVRERLNRFESLDGHRNGNDGVLVNRKISIDVLPQIRPISEIINDLKPDEISKSDTTHEIKPISAILSDLKPSDYHKDESDGEVFETENEINSAIDNNKDHNMREFKSYQSRPHDSNWKSMDDVRRAKSLAELDLGDAVKGKVSRMIVRINSVEILSEAREAPISIKEMPRKRSVSEKIALFERKLTTAKELDPPRLHKNDKTEQKQAEITEDIQEKIAELANAKLKYGKLENVPQIELSNGIMMPVLAVGTALLDPRLTYHIVSAAIDLGYRAIDTAYIYGNEKAVGDAIRAKIADGTVTREELFIISKLWSTFHRSDLVKGACQASLDAMGLDYFDLYLIHNPMSFKEGGAPIPKIATVLQYSEHDYLDAWFGLETLGWKTRALGVSNFNSLQLRRVLDRARIKPVINQVECHPYLSQQRLDLFCSERNVTLSCFGVLGSKGTPLEFKSGQPAAIDDAFIQVMASGLNVSPAQLLIRYQIECGHNVVVKASSAAHLWENLQAVTFNLTAGQVDALHALNRNKRIFTFSGMGDTHKNYPFKIAF